MSDDDDIDLDGLEAPVGWVPGMRRESDLPSIDGMAEDEIDRYNRWKKAQPYEYQKKKFRDQVFEFRELGMDVRPDQLKEMYNDAVKAGLWKWDWDGKYVAARRTGARVKKKDLLWRKERVRKAKQFLKGPQYRCKWTGYNKFGKPALCTNAALMHKRAHRMLDYCGYHADVCVSSRVAGVPCPSMTVETANEQGLCRNHYASKFKKNAKQVAARFNRMPGVMGVEEYEKSKVDWMEKIKLQPHPAAPPQLLDDDSLNGILNRTLPRKNRGGKQSSRGKDDTGDDTDSSYASESDSYYSEDEDSDGGSRESSRPTSRRGSKAGGRKEHRKGVSRARDGGWAPLRYPKPIPQDKNVGYKALRLLKSKLIHPIVNFPKRGGAARKIQSLVRGHLARTRFAAAVASRKLAPRRIRAARTIQVWFRAIRSQWLFKAFKTKVNKSMRSFQYAIMAFRARVRVKRSNAAKKIQRMYQTWKIKDFLLAMRAVTLIKLNKERRIESQQKRKGGIEYNAKRRKAAVQIQRVMRGYLGRKRFHVFFECYTWAAVTIQQKWRGYKERPAIIAELEEARHAVRVIQRFVRLVFQPIHNVKKKEEMDMGPVAIMQAVCRGWLARRYAKRMRAKSDRAWDWVDPTEHRDEYYGIMPKSRYGLKRVATVDGGMTRVKKGREYDIAIYNLSKKEGKMIQYLSDTSVSEPIDGIYDERISHMMPVSPIPGSRGARRTGSPKARAQTSFAALSTSGSLSDFPIAEQVSVEQFRPGNHAQVAHGRTASAMPRIAHDNFINLSATLDPGETPDWEVIGVDTRPGTAVFWGTGSPSKRANTAGPTAFRQASTAAGFDEGARARSHLRQARTRVSTAVAKRRTDPELLKSMSAPTLSEGKARTVSARAHARVEATTDAVRGSSYRDSLLARASTVKDEIDKPPPPKPKRPLALNGFMGDDEEPEGDVSGSLRDHSTQSGATEAAARREARERADEERQNRERRMVRARLQRAATSHQARTHSPQPRGSPVRNRTAQSRGRAGSPSRPRATPMPRGHKNTRRDPSGPAPRTPARASTATAAFGRHTAVGRSRQRLSKTAQTSVSRRGPSSPILRAKTPMPVSTKPRTPLHDRGESVDEAILYGMPPPPKPHSRAAALNRMGFRVRPPTLKAPLLRPKGTAAASRAAAAAIAHASDTKAAEEGAASSREDSPSGAGAGHGGGTGYGGGGRAGYGGREGTRSVTGGSEISFYSRGAMSNPQDTRALPMPGLSLAAGGIRKPKAPVMLEGEEKDATRPEVGSGFDAAAWASRMVQANLSSVSAATGSSTAKGGKRGKGSGKAGTSKPRNRDKVELTSHVHGPKLRPGLSQTDTAVAVSSYAGVAPPKSSKWHAEYRAKQADMMRDAFGTGFSFKKGRDYGLQPAFKELPSAHSFVRIVSADPVRAREPPTPEPEGPVYHRSVAAK